jgi:hypothetical protein
MSFSEYHNRGQSFKNRICTAKWNARYRKLPHSTTWSYS